MITDMRLGWISDTAVLVGIIAALSNAVFPGIALISFSVAACCGLVVAIAYFLRSLGEVGHIAEEPTKELSDLPTTLESIGERGAQDVTEDLLVREDFVRMAARNAIGKTFGSKPGFRFRIYDQGQLDEEYLKFYQAAIMNLQNERRSPRNVIVNWTGIPKAKRRDYGKVIHKSQIDWLERAEIP